MLPNLEVQRNQSLAREGRAKLPGGFSGELDITPD
jgi:hypothetical protein